MSKSSFVLKCEKLYEEFEGRQDADPDAYFTQEDLLAAGATENDITQIFNTFLQRKCVRLLSLEGTTCYKFRRRDVADKLMRLSQEEMMIYSQIEEGGVGGLWIKGMIGKTNIPRPTVTKIIKTLEGKKLIKGVTSVKTPARRIYILYHLQAAEDVSGNAFYDQGELDTGLIEEVSKVVKSWITELSWNISDEVVAQHSRPSSIAELKSKQRAVYAAGGGRGGSSKFRPPDAQTRTVILPYPPSYTGYPSAQNVHEMVNNSNILTGVELSEDNIQSILTAMVWDGQLEIVHGDLYRVVRSQLSLIEKKSRRVQPIRDMEDEGNGFTDAPCSRCPVFNLCEEGGPVSASNCEYYDQWLHPQKHKMVATGDGYMITPKKQEELDKLEAQLEELERQDRAGRA